MMYFESLENKTRFEAGRVYYYHYSCNYDTLAFMQVVSVSDTRKTAMIQKMIGGKPDGKPVRKKIDNYSGVESISAGNYSMAGCWSADEWDKSQLFEDLGIEEMHKHERAEALEILPEMPAAATADTVYTVDIRFCDKNYNLYGEILRDVSLADMVKYISDNADAILDVLGEKWYIDFTLYKNGQYLCDSITGKTTDGDILEELYYKLSEEEYNAIEAEISEKNRSEIIMTSFDPENDPDPTDPTPTPDSDIIYSDFDNYFNSLTVTSVRFGGAQNSAETGKKPAKSKRKKLTEKEWKKQLEAKAAFEAAEKAEKVKKTDEQIKNAKIGDEIFELNCPEARERIVKIEREDECGEIFVTFYTDCGNIYEESEFYDHTGLSGLDFYPATMAFTESSEPEQPDEDQITFDEIAAYSTSHTPFSDSAKFEIEPTFSANNFISEAQRTAENINFEMSQKNEFIMQRIFDDGKINLYYNDNGDLIGYFIGADGKYKSDKIDGYAAEFAAKHLENVKNVKNTVSPKTDTNCDGIAYSENESSAPSPINEELAKRAKESYSFSDYTPGSATAAYNAAVADVRATANSVRERIPEEYRSELDKLVNRYAVRLADWTNRKNRADASCPSWFITGAANYPHRKREKQMQQLDRLFEEYDQITSLENRIKNFEHDIKFRPIKSGAKNAVDKLRAKVKELTDLQERMKQANAEARKQGKTAPYAAWALSNNRQNLKRYSDRLAAIEKAKSASAEHSEEVGEGFRIIRNTDIMRLQVIFDDKPNEETRNILKENGFKWAPSHKAWQRQLNNNGEYALKQVMNTINQ